MKALYLMSFVDPAEGLRWVLSQALGNWGEERLVSTVCACVAPQVFVGNLETILLY